MMAYGLVRFISKFQKKSNRIQTNRIICRLFCSATVEVTRTAYRKLQE